jgi:hypothetical protein
VAPGRVYTTEASSASGRVYTTQWPLQHLDVSPCQRGQSCTWTCLNKIKLFCSSTFLQYRSLCCTLMYLYTVEACAAPGVVYTTVQGPKLHVDVSGQQQLVLLLLRCLYHRDLSCRWTCLHWGDLCCSWGCLDTSSLCCSWIYLHYRGLC